MYGKTDRNLETKEGKTMSHLVQKPPIPLSPQKTSCYADVFTGLPESGNRPNQRRGINQNQLHQHRKRWGGEIKVVRILLLKAVKNKTFAVKVCRSSHLCI